MIWTALALDLLRRFWLPIASAIAGIGLYLRGRKDARTQADARDDEHARAALEDAIRLDRDLDRLPPDERLRRARRWERD